jgi:hypothetical protein
MLLYLIAWFLLPLIPAYILFRFLPGTGKVESPGGTEGKDKDENKDKVDETNMVKGPLKGLGIKFTGAFAGYLVLFLLSKEVLNDRMKKIEDPKEVWTIKGDIVSLDKKFNAQDEKPAVKIDPLDQVIGNSTFDVKVVAQDDGKGYLDFPKLDFITTNYAIESLPDLDFNKIKRNIDTLYNIDESGSRIIRLKYPLVLKLSVQPPLLPLPGEEIIVDTSFFNN